ncbi:J domain-containing protein [bacterium]|nr:J domain-containing protein [Candidatus Elulimicrobium humile]
MTDYYDILGVDKNASPDEIKQAYRKLAGRHHPDRGGDTQQFQRIQEAYNTLGDPQKKQEYDTPKHFFQQEHHFGDINDVFNHFMNFGFGNQFHRPQQRNRSINLQTTVSLRDAFAGKDLMANFAMPNGQQQSINIKIPPGIEDGTTLRLHGLGDNTHPHMPRGDINLTVNIAPDPIYQRQGGDLIYRIEISCIEAMLGCKKIIPTIDNNSIEVNIHAGIQNEQVLNAQGHGMPIMRAPHIRGNLLMPIKINIPMQISEHQKSLLRQW